mgnify:CR=1 FL=1
MIGDDTAFLGSANLTDTGLKRNTEIGVYLKDHSERDELQSWFDDLWSQTEPADIPSLQTYVDKSEPMTSQDTASMPDVGPSIKSSLPFSEQPNIPVEDPQQEALVEAIASAPNREWIDTYFDWVGKLISFTDLDEDDERIATTIPKPDKIPVNINQRYVLTTYPDQGKIGIILPGDSDAVEELVEYISDWGQFSTPDETDPYWFEFPNSLDEFISGKIEEDWQRAVKRELTRADRSSHRNSHNSAVYRAAVDNQYRQKILNVAFSGKNQD